MPSAKPIERKTQLSRDEWLTQALEIIGLESRGWIGINELVERLGVTKGSFYWHFEDRQDFVQALMAHWTESMTTHPALEIKQKTDQSAEDQLLELALAIVEQKLDRYDVAIRVWAQQEPQVARMVTKVDAFREQYISALFRKMGFRGQELQMRTRTFQVFYGFEAALGKGITKAEQLRAVKLRHRMLVKK